MKYKILSSDKYDNNYSSEECLAIKVNKALAEGWELQGGVTSGYSKVGIGTSYSGGLAKFEPYLQLFQAVVKYENKNSRGKF